MNNLYFSLVWLSISIGSMYITSVHAAPPSEIPAPPFAKPAVNGSVVIVDSTGRQVGNFIGIDTKTSSVAVAFSGGTGNNFGAFVSPDGFVTYDGPLPVVHDIVDYDEVKSAVDAAANLCPPFEQTCPSSVLCTIDYDLEAFTACVNSNLNSAVLTNSCAAGKQLFLSFEDGTPPEGGGPGSIVSVNDSGFLSPALIVGSQATVLIQSFLTFRISPWDSSALYNGSLR